MVTLYFDCYPPHDKLKNVSIDIVKGDKLYINFENDLGHNDEWELGDKETRATSILGKLLAQDIKPVVPIRRDHDCESWEKNFSYPKNMGPEKALQLTVGLCKEAGGLTTEELVQREKNRTANAAESRFRKIEAAFSNNGLQVPAREVLEKLFAEIDEIDRKR